MISDLLFWTGLAVIALGIVLRFLELRFLGQRGDLDFSEAGLRRSQLIRDAVMASEAGEYDRAVDLLKQAGKTL